jgi:PilZ domain
MNLTTRSVIRRRWQLDAQRRRAMRFPVDAPVVFWWHDAIGKRQQGEGRSYDVSELGAFVLASLCPPAGAQVNLKISIAAVTDAPRSLRMQVHGRVLRVEHVGTGQGRDGFAILSDRAVFDEEDKSTEEENSTTRNKPQSSLRMN